MIKRLLITDKCKDDIDAIKKCRANNITTIAVFSEPDRESQHAKMADEAICIGPEDVDESYLNVANIINACVLKECDTILVTGHDKRRSLLDNPRFEEICNKCNIQVVSDLDNI